MARLPLTLRALVLVPLLAAGVDVTRATVACGSRAESCLEAAGSGWLGAAGPALLVLYAVALALAIAGLVRGGPAARAPGFLRSWAIGSAGVAAVCGGQALIAGALGDPAALGGGWAELLALCVLAGAVLALALRVAPAAGELVRGLRPAVPRLAFAAAPVLLPGAPLARRPRILPALARRGRGPPVLPG